MKVYYSPKQVADQGQQNLYTNIQSPSSKKPEQIAAALAGFLEIEFVEPKPLSIDDFKLCHDSKYVDDIFSLQRDNGFGNRSQAIADTLPYTNGAMYDAAKAATADKPTCALVAGFHHAGYNGWEHLGYFCTFNGLVITAFKLLNEGTSRVAIIDCDMHWGNGTDEILPRFHKPISHITFGKFFTNPVQADQYLECLSQDGIVERHLLAHKPDIILYQAGADVHVDDPYGGVLTTDQIYERDHRMFQIAKNLQIPIVWNLAGGYQIEPDGSIPKVIEIHLNTFKACQEVYKN